MIATLIAAAIVLLATTDTASGNIAAVAALAGAVGIGWQGVGQAIWRAASRVERPLWGAAVNIAISQAITRLPKPSSRSTAVRNASGARATGSDPQ